MSSQNSELRTQKSSSQFSEPQIEYPLGGSSKKSSHVYFLLQVFWVILLYDINVVLISPWWPGVTIVQSDVTIVVPWQLSTGSIHDYPFYYCPLVGILFEVRRFQTFFTESSYWSYTINILNYQQQIICQ